MKANVTGIFIIFAAALLVSGCCSCRKVTTVSENARGGPFIDVATAGGFAGRTSGYLIMHDGTVVHHARMGSTLTNDTLGFIEGSVISELRVLTVKHDLIHVQVLRTGNMTTSLDITNGDTPHRISWSGMYTEIGDAPEEVQPFYKRLVEILAPYHKKAMEQTGK